MRHWAMAVGLLAVVCAGCDSGPELGIVHGKVVIPGQSAEQIRIEFHPDVADGTDGPSSVGETDAEGNFTLNCVIDEHVKPGAIIGKHRVVLQDMRLAESETGRGIRQRLPASYAMVLTTPQTAEVKAGEQEIVLEPKTK